MRKEDKAITFEQAKILAELGIIQEKSMMAWVQNKCRNESDYKLRFVVSEGVSYYGYSGGRECLSGYSAFTVAELGLLLPPEFYSTGASWKREPKGYNAMTPNKGFFYKIQHHYQGATEVTVRYLQLLDIIDNRLMTIDEINQQYLERIGDLLQG